MKIVIDEGHNRGQDQGAVGIGNENDMNIATGEKVISKLQALGHQVLRTLDYVPQNVDVSTSLADRVNAANNWGADLYVSIHANCGGGHGTEVWIGSESSRDVATRIVNNIAAIGYTNRGVKVQGIDGEHLYVLNNTTMPALLIEQCFVDSASDMAGFNSESMANAIVQGITAQLPEGKEEDIMNEVVLYFGDADLFAAVIVSQKEQCPLMKYQDFNDKGLKSNKVIQIGGPGATAAGTDRFQTFKAAANLL